VKDLSYPSDFKILYTWLYKSSAAAPANLAAEVGASKTEVIALDSDALSRLDFGPIGNADQPRDKAAAPVSSINSTDEREDARDDNNSPIYRMLMAVSAEGDDAMAFLDTADPGLGLGKLNPSNPIPERPSMATALQPSTTNTIKSFTCTAARRVQGTKKCMARTHSATHTRM
jgi:hypothetical protein